jgi:PepB aminopeptidase
MNISDTITSHLTVFLTASSPSLLWNKKSLFSFSSAEHVNIHIEPSNDSSCYFFVSKKKAFSLKKGYFQENKLSQKPIPSQKSLDSLRRIQQAARKLSEMNIESFQLKGEWDLESQWHFWQGIQSPKKSPTLLFSTLSPQENDYLQALIKTYHWAKTLINTPPECLPPLTLAQKSVHFLEKIAPGKITYRFIEGEALKKEGLMGLYHVGRGSEHPPVFLELDYSPHQSDEPIASALVGKGITFDSGGYSLKSSVGMLTMKCDMGGAATVTAALGLAIMQGLKTRVKLYLCCAENLVSDHAYKLSDIITYKNGVTVEVVNTDAEGRLVLADGLLYANASGSPLIIDAATLTGAACVALGDDYNALFTQNDALSTQLHQIAKNAHDPIWRLPLDSFHQDYCPSYYAMTANSRPQPGGGWGGASNAAGFLSRFIDEEQKKWAHFDLSASFKQAPDHLFAAGSTGRGIRTIAHLLLEQPLPVL